MSNISRTELLDFLQKNNIAVVSTVSPEGIPESASVFVHIADNFSFFFLTKTETRKYLNLRQNGYIALVFTNGKEMKTVQITGVVTPLINSKEQIEMLQILSEESHHRYRFLESPVEQIRDGDLVVVRVDPEWIRYADFDGITGEPEHFQDIPVE